MVSAVTTFIAKVPVAICGAAAPESRTSTEKL